MDLEAFENSIKRNKVKELTVGALVGFITLILFLSMFLSISYVIYEVS